MNGIRGLSSCFGGALLFTETKTTTTALAFLDLHVGLETGTGPAKT